jgi:hypothetical protein
MPRATAPAAYKSPLHEMTQATPTCLGSGSASIQERRIRWNAARWEPFFVDIL